MSTPLVEVGTKLPEQSLYGDPTFIVSTAIATRDYQDVHHDRDKAQAKGSKDIFVNILTDTGLVERFVTDWAGPDASVTGLSVKLGTPNLPGDTMKLRGKVIAADPGERSVEVEIVGKNSWGNHVQGKVTLTLPAGA